VDAETRHEQYRRACASLASGAAERSPAGAFRVRQPADAPAAMAELLRSKARLKPLLVTLEVPREAAGTSPEALEARMLGRLLAGHPELTENLLAVRETLFAGESPRDRFPPWFGPSVLALTAWDPLSLAAALGPGLAAGTAAGVQPARNGVQPSTIRLRLRLPERFFPRAGERLLQYLAAEHAAVTSRRVGPALLLQPGARALKRKVLLSGSVRAAAEGVVAELTVGPRFRLRRYLELFPEPEVWQRALVEVLALD
jgi:hypothetical protein